MYFADQPFQEKMMQQLDFGAVAALGMIAPGTIVKKADQVLFKVSERSERSERALRN
tara:strand:- start:191 stop:361 length:171 start_codon:yes stop_codon:yes gene_type:complete